MTTQQLEAAIAYWTNCLGKGTRAQQRMTRRTIAELEARRASL